MKELIAIQSDLKAPKSEYNSFGNYHYRTAEDILEALKPLLRVYDCTLTLTDEIILVGARYYVKATASIINSEGMCKEACSFAREEENKKGMDSSQITGSASSYARKYALNGLFLIDDTKDADSDKPKTTSTTKKPVFSIEEVESELLKFTTKQQIKDYYSKSPFKGNLELKNLCTEIANKLKQ